MFCIKIEVLDEVGVMEDLLVRVLGFVGGEGV